MFDVKKIYEARERIKEIAVDTPFSYAPHLSQSSGCNVYLKKENLQITGAFKIRGAYNKVASLSDEQKACGVIAASAGNHAQGVALSASKFGIKAVIVMPESTPLTKINGVKNYGAEVILHGTNYDEAYAYAIEHGKKNSLTFIHPFEDEYVIAGQGTLALDILDKCKDLDAVVIPVGGGGLISGMAAAFKSINPKIEVIGVSAKGAPALKNSFELKKPIDSLSVRTIADGIAVRDTSPITLAYMLETVDRFISVDDEEIASAILFLLEKQKLVVEGAGAVGVAALLHDKLEDLKNKNVAIVLSGGNMDVTLLSVIIEKGLLKSGRKMKFTVTLVDKPGSLMRFTQILQELNANIVHIAYDRTSISLDYGDANVTVHVETKGEEHQQTIYKVLKEENYIRGE
ncbi:threonine ammonia-lyase [Sulfurimonas sp. CVO]|uniref:Threonine ammonia-lyase n=1 Tax=Sulfurimonas xiamenensis TaxID=2590021 RepID=A0AAJ4A3H0_9BACT|nr:MULTISPECIES: threonine ammonia-lyase [Sulfurimonas]PLY13656.1 MAG: threonine ammonia-lyase [Sulfurimonas sp.]QFR43246.1 threonine ammonia-lyase [Sulfurimonas xiamenensis]QHG91205.1 threonine ammonia-lyase [Sulfurimonas sp. CVO]